MEAKDQEIQRISQQRDRYQELVFARLKSSYPDTFARRNDGSSVKE
jgi:hypothetical protein